MSLVRNARNLVVSFMVALAGICGTVPLSAEGFQPVNPEELKITNEPLAPNASAIILYRQVDREDALAKYGASTTVIGDAGGKENVYVRIKILTQDGLKYATVEIPFDKWEAIDIRNLHARTIHPDGSVAEFAGNASVKQSNGKRVKTFTSPDVTLGSVIEYYYTVILSEAKFDWGIWGSPSDSRWILSDELFTKRARFSLLPSRGDQNNPVHVRWRWNYLPQGALPPQQGSDHIIRMALSNIPGVQWEEFMPPINEIKSRVDFTYTSEYETDATKYWRLQDKKLYTQFETFAGKGKGIQETLGQIVAANDSPEAKLHKIYTRVQQIRNITWDGPKNDDEKKHLVEKANTNVDDVLQHGFGSSIQLNWLFLALARAAGLDAFPVYASNRGDHLFKAANMDVSELDSRVVLLKLNGKDMYFDPGTPFTPFGLLPWNETQVQGLKLDRDGGAWIVTSIPASADSRILREGVLTFSDKGTLEGKVTETFTGLEGMTHRKNEIQDDDAARKRYLEEDLKSQIASGSAVELSNRPDWKSSDIPLTAEFTVKIPAWGSIVGRTAFLPLGIFAASEKNAFQSETRNYPIVFEYPCQKEDDVTITVPPGWQIASLPSGQNLDVKAALYAIKVENDKGAVHVHRELNSDMLMVKQEFYPALRNFYQIVRSGDAEQVTFLATATKASN
ncbi:MAG TPA: DUF3857 and transglutaminase domain-containing protein [Terriglobales bacterium]|nr:DUF3857 and transglutaminase domain-containing protein [Terriglobales bacterium]